MNFIRKKGGRKESERLRECTKSNYESVTKSTRKERNHEDPFNFV